MSDFPVGSVLAYGGDADQTQVEKFLNENGWLVCDGSSYAKADHQALFDMIGNRYGGDGDQFAVPDLRGLFIRGTDRGRGANPEDLPIGSFQEDATALPIKTVTADTAGNHAHSIKHRPTGGVDVSHTIFSPPHSMDWTDDGKNSNDAGSHTHTIVGGGDKETRPQNVYLYFLIKAEPQAVTDIVVSTIVAFAADATDPSVQAKLDEAGWSLCNGSPYDPEKYSILETMIGTEYDNDDFKYLLPDLRGMFVVGSSLDNPPANPQPYTTKLPETPFVVSQSGSHTHGVPGLPGDNDKHDSYYVAGPHQAKYNDGSADSGEAGEHTHTLTGGDAETRPVNLTLDFLIKIV